MQHCNLCRYKRITYSCYHIKILKTENHQCPPPRVISVDTIHKLRREWHQEGEYIFRKLTLSYKQVWKHIIVESNRLVASWSYISNLTFGLHIAAIKRIKLKMQGSRGERTCKNKKNLLSRSAFGGSKLSNSILWLLPLESMQTHELQEQQ